MPDILVNPNFPPPREVVRSVNRMNDGSFAFSTALTKPDTFNLWVIDDIPLLIDGAPIVITS